MRAILLLALLVLSLPAAAQQRAPAAPADIPGAANDSDQGRAQNRRVEIVRR